MVSTTKMSVFQELLGRCPGTCCHPTLDYGPTSHKNTRSRQISEVKGDWAWLVLA